MNKLSGEHMSMPYQLYQELEGFLKAACTLSSVSQSNRQQRATALIFTSFLPYPP